MRSRLSRSGVMGLGLLIFAGTQLSAQPANDTCANASPITIGTTNFDTTGATTGTSAAPSCATTSGFDVWFDFTAPNNATYQFDTIGSGFDPVITIYDAACVPGVLDQLVCNQGLGGGSPQARAFILATAGTTYRVRVSGHTGGALPAFGPGVLNVVEVPIPSNNSCTTPIGLSMGQTVTVDTTASTTSPNYSCPMGPDLWYSVTAPGNGLLVVDKDVLYHHAIYAGGCPSSILDELYCSLQEHTAFPVTAGQNLLIRVAPNVQSTSAAIGILTVDFQTIAANDECSQAAPFALGSTLAIDCINATLDPSIEITCNPPPFGDNLLYADLWYSITAPNDGVLTVELSNDPQATPYHVIYDGGGCPLIGDELQCSQPSFSSTSVTQGQTCLIRVGTSFDAQFYTGDLTIDVITGNNNDECTGATPLVSGVPTAVDTSLASISSGYSCQIEGDLWYEFLAPSNGFLATTLDMTANASHVVYHAPGGTGTCPTNGDELACVQFYNLSSVAVTGGELYMIRISGTQFSGPAIGTVQVDFLTSPANDDCTTPDLIASPGVYPFSTIPATGGTPGLSGDCLFPMDKDIWFAYTAPATGILILDFDTNQVVHGIYTRPAGGGCPASADNIMCISAPFLSNTPVSAGQEYLIRLGAFDGSPGTAGNMTLDFAGPPTNDDCTGSDVITVIPSTTAWDTAGANDDTNGLNGGPGCLFGPFEDVWFTFNGPAPGLMKFTFTV